MRLLLDTQVLLWVVRAVEPPRSRISAEAIALISDPENEILFSVLSLWEITIKSALGREDFATNAKRLRRILLADGFLELPIDAEHCFAVADLPPLHRDPFDRLLIAQAIVEGVTLLTADAKVAAYPGPIIAV